MCDWSITAVNSTGGDSSLLLLVWHIWVMTDMASDANAGKPSARPLRPAWAQPGWRLVVVPRQQRRRQSLGAMNSGLTVYGSGPQTARAGR
jgi:hypothetical protein